MSPLWFTLLITLPAILGILSALWLVSVWLRDASIIDPFWGTGFAITAWLAVAVNGTPSVRSLLLASLTTLWGLRLSLYLLFRNWGHGEDRRYVAMREHHGVHFWWVSLLTVFLLQGVILWLVSWPLQGVASHDNGRPISWLDSIGIVLWAIGVLFETIGDWQLARFKRHPENCGKVLDRGLWRYTRHPNYFGDFCVWWGLYLIAVAGGAGWTVISPIVMSVLLMKVSGVTLLESTISERRPEYAAYRTRTNAFFPGPPK